MSYQNAQTPPGRGGWQANRGSGGGGNWNGGNRGGGQFQRREEGDPAFYRPYVLSGNDGAPESIVSELRELAKRLEQCGFTLRTRGMKGIESDVGDSVSKKEEHIPWKGFDEKETPYSFTTPDAKALARSVDPGFETRKPFVQTFLAANAKTVLGKNLISPALFVLIWTKDGVERLVDKTQDTGVTTHLIAVADAMRVPVFNIGKPGCGGRLVEYLRLDQPFPKPVKEPPREEAPTQDIPY